MKAKLVNEPINKNINESLIKINNHVYKFVNTPNGHMYIGKDGILGKDNVFISWDMIKKYRYIQ